MNPRNLILVIVALVIAGVAAVLVRGIIGQPPQQQQQQVIVVGPKILVAARDLPIGKMVEAPDLRWQSWPDDNISESYLRDSVAKIEDFTGHVVRHGIMAGEPITKSRVVAPGERGFMAAVLQPGMRAMTLRVNETTGISGLIFPGDRVDLILIRNVVDDNGIGRQVSETVLKNVRVLAIDADANDQTNTAKLGKTITVEVTPKIAEEVAMIASGSMGAFTLSLRSLSEIDGEDPENFAISKDDLQPDTNSATHTWDADVSNLVPPLDIGSTKHEITVSRADENQLVEFKRKKE